MNPTINTILYATDMGKHMRPVFHYAIDMANKHDAKIVMLHVIEPFSSSVISTIDVYMPEFNAKDVRKDGMKKVLKEMQNRLNNFCKEELKKKLSDCKIVSKVKVVSGHSAESIVDQAEKIGANLIVIGTHTRPSITSNIIGSTARKVTQISRTPVLIVPVYE